jgi:hypothetical protein
MNVRVKYILEGGREPDMISYDHMIILSYFLPGAPSFFMNMKVTSDILYNKNLWGFIQI